MTKVNRVEELPNWFNLDKYADTESFDASDWFKHLIYRKEMFDMAPYLTKAKLSNMAHCSLGINERQLAKLEEIRQTPLHTFGDRYFIPISSPETQPIKPLNFLHLREQFKADIRAAKGQTSEPSFERWLHLEANSRQISSNRTLLEAPILLTNYDDSDHETHVISVDLRTTDSVLVKAFEKWLEETRAQQGSSSKRNRPAYKDWTRYGLLPYLDLLIWSIQTTTHIPRRIYSAAVSHFNYGESSFSKTVVPLANNLMKDLSELRSLAQAESHEHEFSPEEFFQEILPE